MNRKLAKTISAFQKVGSPAAELLWEWRGTEHTESKCQWKATNFRKQRAKLFDVSIADCCDSLTGQARPHCFSDTMYSFIVCSVSFFFFEFLSHWNKSRRLHLQPFSERIERKEKNQCITHRSNRKAKALQNWFSCYFLYNFFFAPNWSSDNWAKLTISASVVLLDVSMNDKLKMYPSSTRLEKNARTDWLYAIYNHFINTATPMLFFCVLINFLTKKGH